MGSTSTEFSKQCACKFQVIVYVDLFDKGDKPGGAFCSRNQERQTIHHYQRISNLH